MSSSSTRSESRGPSPSQGFIKPVSGRLLNRCRPRTLMHRKDWSMLAAQVQPERRQSERDEVFYRTRASAPGLGNFPVQVVNISANGLMARTEADVQVGQDLTI